MPSHHQVVRRLRDGETFEQVGRDLGVSPGLVYLLATGIPADGSDTLAPDESAREFVVPTSQHLVGAPAIHPTSKGSTRAWIRRRVAADGPMQAAAARDFQHSQQAPHSEGAGSPNSDNPKSDKRRTV